MIRSSIFFTLLALFSTYFFSAPGILYGQERRPIVSPSSPLKIAEYMEAAKKAEHFSGSILIAKNGKVLFSRGYGMANLELSVPNSPKTVFQIASLTKAFTATAVMQLQIDKKLNVEDSICLYLPGCPAAWQSITIKHLLTHTSGIPNYTSFPDYEKTAAQFTSHEEIVGRFRNKPLEFLPGSQFKYNNSGYHLLGLIIEKVAGRPYGEYLRERIFTPLGMKDSFSGPSKQILRNRASGYAISDEESLNSISMDLDNIFAEGGIVSTTEDLLIWDQALYTEKILPREVQNEVLSPYQGTYGYGWNIKTLFDRKEINHSGRNFGFSTHIKRFPDDHVTVIVLSNNQLTEADNIAKDLAAILFAQPYRIPRVPVLIDPMILEKYVGTYDAGPGGTISITFENGKLHAQGSGQGKVPIFPASSTKFFLKNVDAEVSFNRDGAGRVVSMSLWRDGKVTTSPRHQQK